MEIAAGWLFFAALVGWAASQKGRSGIGWFLISILISPLIAAIIVLIIPRVAPPTTQPVIGVADELAKLATLRDTGAITSAEFERQRAMLLPPGPATARGPATWSSEPPGRRGSYIAIGTLVIIVVIAYIASR